MAGEKMKIKTILIIDDSHLDRYIITEFLGSGGDYNYEFIECSTVEQGLAVLDNLIPDCILLDNIMPDSDMGGIKALPMIKDTINKLTPIIMITGAPDDDAREIALSQGASYFLDKTKIEPDMLNNLIVDLIEQNEAIRKMTA